MAKDATAVTVSVKPRAAASMAVFRGSGATLEVLMIERGKGALPGLWSLPGGRIEPGETARDAALREVVEETGVVAEMLGLLDVQDVFLRASDGSLIGQYLIAVHYGRAAATSTQPIAASDARSAKYVALTDLAHLNLTADASTLIHRAAKLLPASRMPRD